MYTKEVAFKNMKEVKKVVDDRLTKVNDSNRSGTKFILELCNTVFQKIYHDLKFLNEENHVKMSKVHSELLTDIKFLLNQSTVNVTNLLHGLD